MRDEYKTVTLEMLLSHRSGIIANTAVPGGATRDAARVTYLEAALAQPRGAQAYLYSNVGYVASAMMAETVTGKAWDALMREEVLEPLGMVGCGVGFGMAGDPFPHRFQGDRVQVQPMNYGNPRVLDGADQMRCPLTAFARYVSAHLTGERGGSRLLKTETWKRLHSDVAGQSYALGWGVGTRPWARGTVLTHSGSNTLNYAVMWLAPQRGIAMVIATNVGVDETNSLTRVTGIADQGVGALLQELLKLAP
jgi:CubicO group peptidase (beta-lactamase class C family)